jgi:hypothetical protein
MAIRLWIRATLHFSAAGIKSVSPLFSLSDLSLVDNISIGLKRVVDTDSHRCNGQRLLFLRDCLQIGQNVTSEEGVKQGSSGETKPTPTAKK